MRTTRREIDTPHALQNIHNSTVNALLQKMSSKKDPNRRVSVISELNANEEISKGMMANAVSASMPVLSCSNCLVQKQEMEKLKSEVAELKKTLRTARLALDVSQKSEKAIRERLSAEAKKQIMMSEKFEDVSISDDRQVYLIQQYEQLYSQARVDVLDSLDSLEELSSLENLKSKLLFSVIVLSFRLCRHKINNIKEKIVAAVGGRKGKGNTAECESSIGTVELSAMTHIRQHFDYRTLAEEVQTQLYATLYDYPCLRQCARLNTFIEECVRIAWKLSVKISPAHIEFDCKTFDESKHVRFHTSNGESDQVKLYIWPSLVESKTGCCLSKGVVST